MTCPLGEPDVTKCPKWVAGSEGAATPMPGATPITGDGFAMPWSASALGLADLPLISGRSAPRVVGLMGMSDAGKTTLLGAWYLLLIRGVLDAEFKFAGSYTLEGWEHIAHSLRWTNAGGPGFPLHTPHGEGRAPGLLHLARRSDACNVEDVLFADAHGEWFREWAFERDAVNAQGARWLADHASVIIIAADCDALSGVDRGAARGTLQALIHRVASERRGRPCALVWTKADKIVPDAIRVSIENTLSADLGVVPTFSVSVYPKAEQPEAAAEEGFVDLFRWAMEAQTPAVALKAARPKSSDPLLVYGYE